MIISNRQIAEGLQRLGLAYMASPLSSRKTDKLIFLCGANRATNVPSFRREAVKRFIEKSPGYKVIYAEPVFNELIRIHQGRSRTNALDLEHEITNLVDKVIIVMESAGAICELGAFAHSELRKKLIVLNDNAHRSQESFINTGPLAAVSDSKGTVLWYPMDQSITNRVDGIGITFDELSKALGGKVAEEVVTLPNITATKQHLYFVHDLIYLIGPATYKELIAVLELMFGRRSWDVVGSLVGVLRSAGLIVQPNEGTSYTCALPQPFFQHPPSFVKLTARIKHYHLKNNPERFNLGSDRGDDSGGTRPTPKSGDRRARKRAA